MKVMIDDDDEDDGVWLLLSSLVVVEFIVDQTAPFSDQEHMQYIHNTKFMFKIIYYLTFPRSVGSIAYSRNVGFIRSAPNSGQCPRN
jgi:hypothetical protein